MNRRAFIVLLFSLILELFGFKKRELEPSNFYKFKLGKTALRIRPDETFTATIHWPTNLPETRVRVRAVLDPNRPLWYLNGNGEWTNTGEKA